MKIKSIQIGHGRSALIYTTNKRCIYHHILVDSIVEGMVPITSEYDPITGLTKIKEMAVYYLYRDNTCVFEIERGLGLIIEYYEQRQPC